MICAKTSLPAYVLLTVLRVGERTDRAGSGGKVQVENTSARRKRQYFQIVVKLPSSNVGTLVLLFLMFSLSRSRRRFAGVHSHRHTHFG